MMDTDILVNFTDATVQRPGVGVVLSHLTWAIRSGQTWALTGPVGVGKTTLAEAVAGRLRVSSGSVTWPALGDPVSGVRLVGFREESQQFSYSRHYYQQRYNFIEPHDDLTLAEYLGGDTAEVRALADRLGVVELLERSFIQLSNGQVRRSRIAKALLTKPKLLVLDDPFIGLDVAGRAEVTKMLGGLVSEGLRLVLVTRPDAVPGWVTDVLRLEPLSPQPPLPQGEKGWERGSRTNASRPNPHPSSLSPPLPPLLSLGERGLGAEGAPAIALHNVTVAYGGRPILDAVTWTVQVGERWAIVGPNGSGKSTLLSLLCGDHPQAYSNDVRLFGQRRGSGESIWEVKQRVGLLSPELHLYFTEPLSAFETAVTGFHDVVSRRPASPTQADTVRGLFTEFGIAHLADRPFRQLSVGEQRLVLLTRALVKRPALLILDEPFQGLDPATADRVRDWLDANVEPTQTVLFVTHQISELPQTVDRLLRLDAGRVVEMR